MLRLSAILFLLGLTVCLTGQSPHGSEFTMNCAACHTSDSWEIPMEHWKFYEFPEEKISEMTGWVLESDTAFFNHFNTEFPLRASHKYVDCRLCHPTLIFSDAETTCISCHDDMHSQSVGNDCARCHNVENWLVDNIPELHEMNGFPLVTPHDNLSCVDCHTSASSLRFDRIGNDCLNCHLDDFQNTTNPDHEALGFSTDCTSCHGPEQEWQPASFLDHDQQFFPIHSGAHEGQWIDCIDCHTNPDDYSSFSCVTCHSNPETDNFHDGVDGYVYEDIACLACHPTGDAETTFDHNSTNFPLTGAHITVECLECHQDGFAGTPTNCASCHTQDYTSTINPDHEELNLSTDCAQCHTTDPEWMPASFDIHDEFYTLEGAHATIANNCTACHNSDYVNTPNTCVGCHLDDFNNTTGPDHQLTQFHTDCTTCHTEDAWFPSTFDHDGLYFPIYSGAHDGHWGACTDCHINPDYFAEVSCIVCHINPEMDDAHVLVNGYVYNDVACLACHPAGNADMPFDHNATDFPLTGGHIGVDCLECHENGYVGTSTNCVDCHTVDFNATVNPDHQELNLTTDCAQCHTTEPDWMPASFDIHDEFYTLNGAHATIANDCAACHNGDYVNTPNTCVGCHLDNFNATTSPSHTDANFSTDCTTCHTEDAWIPSSFNHDAIYPLVGAHAIIENDCILCHSEGYDNTPNTCVGCHLDNFNNTTDPNHEQAQFNTDCTMCHTEDAWIPASFDHDGEYFPIYSGAHDGHWSDCIDCHTNQDNYAEVSCINCHINPETDDEHIGVNGYIYNDVACLACHPTGDADMVFDHNDTAFPLTGGHIGVDCLECHENGFEGTSTNCADCHTMDFNATINPNHQELNLPTDCAQCHTTEPNWMPANFDIHDEFYTLNGAHATIANDCAACHNGDYVNTPNTCVGCHLDDFNNTTDPDHQQAQFNTDCTMCHTEDAWIPSNFDHDAIYPLVGAHAIIENDCILCHADGYDNTPNTCVGCHLDDFNNTTDPDHQQAQFNTDCTMCHTEDAWIPASFDHDGEYFPIYSGAHDGHWSDCIDCHANPDNYAEVSCINCHINPETDDVHVGVNGYIYNDVACLACHPTGDADMVFDHNTTAFPLTGGHIGVDCLECHENGFEGTSTNCADCHTMDFNSTVNPNHQELNLPTDCAQCHTTEPNWMPASFDIHDEFYILNGAHATIANDCAACHNGDYINTPNTCVGCHLDDFNNTTDPDHQQAQFNTDCTMCHTEDAWIPSTFDHDGQYFPIYSGAHDGHWSECIDCHSNPDNYAEVSCINCHINPETDDVHVGVNGYIYNDIACLSCHPTGDADMAFDHNATAFPLTGGHIGVDCLECHENGFEGTSTNCADCHTMDFNATINPNHQELNLPTDCAQCHTTEPDWMPATFDIHDEFYTLNGAHATIANDCAACHNGDYVNTPNTCVGCHLDDFNNTTDPDHQQAQFNTDCTMCHTEDAWMPSTFDHDGQYFPIYSGAHDGHWSECIDCHTNPDNYAEVSCITCHLNPETDNVHTGVNGYIYNDVACLACHPTGDADMAFDHNATNFPLTGAHIGVDCLECHESGYAGTPTDCNSCHNPDYMSSTNPNHNLLGIPTDCAQCHTTEPGWAPASFDIHDNYYPLTGEHLTIANDCAACHNGDYNNTPNDCAGCHLPDYNSSTNPDHQVLNIPTDCAQCHTTDPDWVPAAFPIHDNYYPLNGAHALIANNCADCHNGDYNNTPNTCVGCHLDNYNATTSPNHAEANFSTDCTSCHTEDVWVPSTFDHDAIYPLVGAHAAIENDCILCHADGYDNTPNTCVGCHLDDFNNTTDPNHQQAQFNTDCTMCHTEDAWTPSTFDHDSQYFPIYSGAHNGQWSECIDCHTNPDNYAEVSCITCHLNPETDNVHTGVNGYVYNDVACLACHPTGDADNSFDHNATNFPLTGAHIGVDCLECHESGYAGTPTDCNSCHNPDFMSSTNPNHNILGIPTDCAQCHTTESGWAPASFDIHDNYYPLTGEHLVIANDCAACHNGDYNNTPNDCAGCHLPDYNSSTNPDHQVLNIPTDCAQCHTTDPDWVPAAFPIHDNYYPLNGAHALIANDCADCHNGDYNNTPNTCVGCHLDNYNATTSPNHTEANFSTDCTSCHTEDAWIPSTFDHDAIYPLVGAHAAIENDCILCHADGYDNTPNTCVGCHLNDFNNTTDPNHQQAQFNTDCTMCHTEDAWTPSTFDHDSQYFPIYSGAHNGQWSECMDCHINPDNYAEVSCITCHLNPETDNVHTGVNGYIYNDVACLACHPTGDADNSFDHNATNFPLTGAHIGVDCLECHESGYAGTPTDCNSCHNPDYMSSTNPNHNLLGIPTDCTQCHTTEPGWAPASFDIHDNYYPLTGQHLTIANDCAACHNGDYNNTPNDCAGCHLPDYNSSTNPDHQILNIPTDCAQCHTTDPAWMPAAFAIHDDYYPLNGAHALIANNCADCHNGDYNNTPNTCVGCHLDNYNATTSPNHANANFSTDCAACHTEDAWIPSTFNHDAIYPLIGAHAVIANDCLLCHADGYDNTPNTCVGCHLQDYNNTNDPDHQQAQFPTDCLECHNEGAWIPSTFDHDGQFFPIFSGKHKDEWILCTDCHFNTSDYSVFNCLDCHEHNNQAQVDADHSEVNGYVYESNACFACHPEGEN